MKSAACPLLLALAAGCATAGSPAAKSSGTEQAAAPAAAAANAFGMPQGLIGTWSEEGGDRTITVDASNVTYDEPAIRALYVSKITRYEAQPPMVQADMFKMVAAGNDMSQVLENSKVVYLLLHRNLSGQSVEFASPRARAGSAPRTCRWPSRTAASSRSGCGSRPTWPQARLSLPSAAAPPSLPW